MGVMGILLIMMVGMGMIVAMVFMFMIVMVMLVLMGMGVVVVMMVAFLFQKDIEFASVDTGFIHPAKLETGALHPQTGKPGLQNRTIRAQIQQGGHRHIPGDTGGAFEI
jgi:hypothetical protein